MIKPYYPGSNNPLHAVNDWCKVRSLIRALRRGEKLPVVYEDAEDGGGNWLSGTHRVAASEIRAELDGIDPYSDIDIFNVSEWLDELSDEERDFFFDLHNNDAELACDLLDEASSAVEFAELIAARIAAQNE